MICTILSLTLVLSLAACGKTAAPVASVETKTPAAAEKLSGSVSTDGSTSMEKVIGALGEAFVEANPGVDLKRLSMWQTSASTVRS